MFYFKIKLFFALLRYGGKIWTLEEKPTVGVKNIQTQNVNWGFLVVFSWGRWSKFKNSSLKKLHYTLNTKLGPLKQDGKQQNVTSWRKMVDTFSRKSRFVASIFIFPES